MCMVCVIKETSMNALKSAMQQKAHPDEYLAAAMTLLEQCYQDTQRRIDDDEVTIRDQDDNEVEDVNVSTVIASEHIKTLLYAALKDPEMKEITQTILGNLTLAFITAWAFASEDDLTEREMFEQLLGDKIDAMSEDLNREAVKEAALESVGVLTDELGEARALRDGDVDPTAEIEKLLADVFDKKEES